MRLPLLLLLLVACRPAAPTPGTSADSVPAPAPLASVTLPPELDRVLRDYEAGWQGGNEAALAQLFTEDGFVLPSGHPPVRGRPAIMEQYHNSQGALQLRALAYGTSGSLGYILGAYGYGDSLPVPDMGKFTLVLRQDAAGRWLILSDMDNGNSR